MNSNELAEALEKYPDCYPNQWAADMLRQLQAENEELKSKLSKVEEIILDSFNRGKMIGYAEGLMKGKQIGKQV